MSDCTKIKLMDERQDESEHQLSGTDAPSFFIKLCTKASRDESFIPRIIYYQFILVLFVCIMDALTTFSQSASNSLCCT